jgi:hypothetical protein
LETVMLFGATSILNCIEVLDLRLAIRHSWDQLDTEMQLNDIGVHAEYSIKLLEVRSQKDKGLSNLLAFRIFDSRF